MECKEQNKQKLEELTKYIEEQGNSKNDLIMILHKAQELFGYLSEEVILFLSEKLSIPTAKIYGVITFYSHFTTEPKGKHVINVCMGTACFVRGAQDVLDEFKRELKIDVGETTEDSKFSLEALRCVGTCGLAPVLSVNEKVYGYVKVEDVKKIIAEYKEGE